MDILETVPRRIQVLALSSLPCGQAGTRHRAEQYIAALRAVGIDLEVSPFFDPAAHRILYSEGNTLPKALGVARGLVRRARDILRAWRFDIVLILRESAPIGPPVFERLLRAIGIRYVFDFDDAIFLRAPVSANRRWAWLRDPSRVSAAARGAAAVVAGNGYLAEHAKRWNERVTMIMTPVDTRRHTPRSGPRPPGPLVIGWIGQVTTAPYLHLLNDALVRLSRRHDLILRVVGGPYANEGVRIDLREFDVEREADDLRSFDIGVLPEPEDIWTRGKGAYKALTYMATGLPVVASPVGVNPDVILDGKTGYLARTTDEWVDVLDRLMRDPALRAELGGAGRRRVEERYSIDVQAPLLARVLVDAAMKAPARDHTTDPGVAAG